MLGSSVFSSRRRRRTLTCQPKSLQRMRRSRMAFSSMFTWGQDKEMDMYTMYIWNPNGAPCFGWSLRLDFRGLPAKVEVVWGSRYIINIIQIVYCYKEFLVLVDKQVYVFLHLCFFLRMPFVYVGQCRSDQLWTTKIENKIYTTPPLIQGSPTYIGAEIL